MTATATELPTPPAPALIGQKGPRGDVLLALKRSGRMGVRELAQRVGLSLNAVRHHLKELEADGLVAGERVARGGVGAPAMAYGLTAAGEALFPRQYGAALTRVLELLQERAGRAAAVELLDAQFAELEAQVAPALARAATPDERMRVVTAALSEAGYMAEGTATFCCGLVAAHNCALPAVAAKFPEICEAEQRFLARTLRGTVERKAHMLAGACACSYKVRFRAGENG